MARKVEFIKETSNRFGYSITIEKHTKSATRTRPQRINFWVKINKSYTTFYPTLEEAEKLAAGIFFAFDYVHENGLNDLILQK